MRMICCFRCGDSLTKQLQTFIKNFATDGIHIPKDTNGIDEMGRAPHALKRSLTSGHGMILVHMHTHTHTHTTIASLQCRQLADRPIYPIPQHKHTYTCSVSTNEATDGSYSLDSHRSSRLHVVSTIKVS